MKAGQLVAGDRYRDNDGDIWTARSRNSLSQCDHSRIYTWDMLETNYGPIVGPLPAETTPAPIGPAAVVYATIENATADGMLYARDLAQQIIDDLAQAGHLATARKAAA
jgi:hypothetical protein